LEATPRFLCRRYAANSLCGVNGPWVYTHG
jgi:hypothetical protein